MVDELTISVWFCFIEFLSLGLIISQRATPLGKHIPILLLVQYILLLQTRPQLLFLCSCAWTLVHKFCHILPIQTTRPIHNQWLKLSPCFTHFVTETGVHYNFELTARVFIARGCLFQRSQTLTSCTSIDGFFDDISGSGHGATSAFCITCPILTPITQFARAWMWVQFLPQYQQLSKEWTIIIILPSFFSPFFRQPHPFLQLRSWYPPLQLL